MATKRARLIVCSGATKKINLTPMVSCTVMLRVQCQKPKVGPCKKAKDCPTAVIGCQALSNLNPAKREMIAVLNT